MSIKVKPYQSYFGGKEGNGTYQTIINLIPPHEIFCSLYLGNCAITRHIKPAMNGVLNDIDPAVYEAWGKLDLIGKLNNVYHGYLLDCCPALDFLKDFVNDPDKRTFIYLDPPYLKTSRKSQADVYRFEMTKMDHVALLEQITAMPDFMIMISCYPNDLYDLYLGDTWNHKDFYSTIRGG